MIKLEKVKISYRMEGRALSILDIPQWKVQKGEQMALLGASGSGKSTLLHVLSGILSIDTGSVVVMGEPIHLWKMAKRDQLRATRMGYVMQDFHLLSALTARQNVELVMAGKYSRKQKQEKLNALFERIGLQDRMHHRPDQLSRGQQQRVAIARALINCPELILADEPTGSLDVSSARETMSLLLELANQTGATLICATHDLELATRFPKMLHMQEINQVLAAHPIEQIPNQQSHPDLHDRQKVGVAP
ncbi:ABC transporter ATP-binding protein [Marinicrinis sediminis]|uniref:ABC transporter ATP-binding protein n=1 Tax=Marinicrinis sediminis TaxID=1652465 RepID=A0ABW5RBS3_9BACL